jgi:hypothetical protein
VIGYVLEGEYELGLDDQPSKVFKAGETFYEPTGCLHRVSKNPAAKGNTPVLAFTPDGHKLLAVMTQALRGGTPEFDDTSSAITVTTYDATPRPEPAK